MKKDSENKTNITFAMLVDSLNEAYTQQCWLMVKKYCAMHNINLLCFVGGTIDTPIKSFSQKNRVFDLVDKEQIDGIISMSASIGNDISRERLTAFLKRFDPVPIINIGMEIEDMPSIIVDNHTGMYDMIDHFIKVHNYRRIAFICGSEGIPDATIRLEAYKKALRDNNLPVDPALIVPGDFRRESGRNGVITLLDERKVEVEAVVAANDNMAFYAIRELVRRGIRVPEDIAVAGFDNMSDSLSFNPSLTTVDQSVWELGIIAVESLISILENNSIGTITLPTIPVFRESCGCGGIPEITAFLAEDHQAGLSLQSGIIDMVSEHYSDIIKKSGTADSVHQVVNLLISQQRSPDPLFFALFAEKISDIFKNNIGTTRIYDLIDFICAKIFERLKGVEEKDSFQSLWRKILNKVVITGENYFQNQLYLNREQDMLLNSCDMRVTYDKELLKTMIAEELPKMGVNNTFVNLYTEDTGKISELYTCYDQGGFYHGLSSEPFLSKELIPGGLIKREQPFSYMVTPLFFREDQLGFSLFEIGDVFDCLLFEKLYYLLSSILYGSKLVTTIKEYSKNLEILVKERTDELVATQGKLLDVAHKAGMADLATNIIHNAGNLLNSINVNIHSMHTIFAQTKLGRLADANTLLENNITGLSDFIEKDPKGRALLPYYKSLYTTLDSENKKVQDLFKDIIRQIGSLKNFIDQYDEYTKSEAFIEEIDITEVVESLVLEYSRRLQERNITVSKLVATSQELLFKTEKFKLKKILTAILDNAIDALGQVEQPVLTLNWGETDVTVFIQIADNGVGIEPENLKKIFNFGYTDKEDHNGFNLHTCANYINDLKGHIAVDSKGRGQGASFTLIWNK